MTKKCSLMQRSPSILEKERRNEEKMNTMVTNLNQSYTKNICHPTPALSSHLKYAQNNYIIQVTFSQKFKSVFLSSKYRTVARSFVMDAL
mmetsp:Transcript_723/g.1222  ORF Transcript_723/g.1222 Transcript_723/m.1222 type:complete len:90 (-) Transcript_723:28-297(-)